MHLRDRECNVHLVGTPELYQLLLNAFIIQVCEPLRCKPAPRFDPGIFFQFVIGTKIVLIQQQVYLAASFAAE